MMHVLHLPLFFQAQFCALEQSQDIFVPFLRRGRKLASKCKEQRGAVGKFLLLRFARNIFLTRFLFKFRNLFGWNT